MKFSYLFLGVKALVRKGAKVSQKDWLGNDPIFYAIKSSNPMILEALIRGSQEELNLDEQFTVFYRAPFILYYLDIKIQLLNPCS